MATQRETVRLLCKSILNRLENDRSIIFPPRLRQVVQDEIFGLIGPYIMTDEDLKEKTIQKIGARAEMLQDTAFTDSEQYRAARAIVRKSFGDDELNGLYFQRPLKNIAEVITSYLMRSSHIEDVFEADEVLERQIVDIVKRFKQNDLH